MPLDKKYDSMLAYYQEASFNPVPISVEDEGVWRDHLAKRGNLYTGSLGIPVGLLKGRKVLEFGCNSGENALALAHHGADLTLVEPNKQVHPRLRQLFERFNLSDQIISLSSESISGFTSDKKFDLVIAEGFLFCLPDRRELIGRLAGFLDEGGFLVVSWNDRYGMLIEQIKRLFLWRGCALLREDPQSETSLKTAQLLFGEDFDRLNASRSLPVWWKDMLVQPFIVDEWHWSYDELLRLVEEAGCELHSTSPRWPLADHYRWYKNVRSTSERHEAIFHEWNRSFLFFLTGRSFPHLAQTPASEEVVKGTAKLIAALSLYGSTDGVESDLVAVKWSGELDSWLRSFGDSFIDAFADDLQELLNAVKTDSFDQLVESYSKAKTFRKLWGTPYHYLSCRKLA